MIKLCVPIPCVTTLIFFGCFAEYARAQQANKGCNIASTYLLERKIAQGDIEAKYYLANRLLNPQCSEKMLERGISLLTQLAEEGHSGALFDLGKLIISSAETDLDSAQGTDFVRESAQKGHAEAQALFGMLLMSDAEEEVDRQHAIYWLGSAADKGVSHAAKVVSTLYSHGMHGIKADRCLAALWGEAAFLIENPHDVTIADVSAC